MSSKNKQRNNFFFCVCFVRKRTKGKTRVLPVTVIYKASRLLMPMTCCKKAFGLSMDVDPMMRLLLN